MLQGHGSRLLCCITGMFALVPFYVAMTYMVYTNDESTLLAHTIHVVATLAMAYLTYASIYYILRMMADMNKEQVLELALALALCKEDEDTDEDVQIEASES